MRIINRIRSNSWIYLYCNFKCILIIIKQNAHIVWTKVNCFSLLVIADFPDDLMPPPPEMHEHEHEEYVVREEISQNNLIQDKGEETPAANSVLLSFIQQRNEVNLAGRNQVKEATQTAYSTASTGSKSRRMIWCSQPFLVWLQELYFV